MKVNVNKIMYSLDQLQLRNYEGSVVSRVNIVSTIHKTYFKTNWLPVIIYPKNNWDQRITGRR